MIKHIIDDVINNILSLAVSELERFYKDIIVKVQFSDLISCISSKSINEFNSDPLVVIYL